MTTKLYFSIYFLPKIKNIQHQLQLVIYITILNYNKYFVSRKSAGLDYISPIVLKHYAPVLVPHLKIFLGWLFSASEFPSISKESRVVKIFKSESNGRNCKEPIVIEPAFAKVFEGIVLVSLYSQLGSRIFSEQHGFLWGRVTTTNLYVFLEFIVSAFTNSNLSWF